MEEKLNMGVKGHLTLTLINGDDKEVVYDDHNALVPNYKNIVRRALGGQTGYFIDNVIANKLGSPLANTPIINVEYIALTDNEVKFTARFSQASFNDTLDEVKLNSVNGGDFSIVSGLSILKDNLTSLQVDWTLKIINQ